MLYYLDFPVTLGTVVSVLSPGLFAAEEYAAPSWGWIKNLFSL